MTRFCPVKSLPTVLLALIACWTATAQTYTISTVAGVGTAGVAGDNGPATGAQIDYAYAVAADSAGNMYIAEPRDNRIRKVSNGVITTTAGNGMGGLSGNPGFSGDNGPATSAQLANPYGIAADSAGNFYIADTNNNRIRKVSNGVITTIAGVSCVSNTSADGCFSGDNVLATSAQLHGPWGVAVDSAGNVYFADFGNSRIRKITTNGVITTVAGNGTPGFGGDNGPATSASLYYPTGVAVDSAGNLYIADIDNNRIRRVSNGTITTVAGNGKSGFGGDDGPAIGAQLNSPTAVAVDSGGNLYIADTGNGRIRKVVNGVIATIAGNGTAGFSGDNGPATSAEFANPVGVAVDSAGNVYVADATNNRIRLLTPVAVPSINLNGIVPIYSSVPVIESSSWVSIYGSGLANGTSVWNGDFPTFLGNVSVTINNKAAYLWSVSPTQINLQAPDDATTGIVNVAVNTPSGIASSTVTLAQYAPSFSLLGDGKHVAGEILTPNGSGAYGGGTYDLVGTSNAFSFSTRPVQQGETLILFGVGFGPTTPNVSAGQTFIGIARTNSPVTITIGGVSANVSFAGITEAGLYQINLTVPSNTGSGDQPLQATVNGVQTPIGPVVTVQ